MASLSVPDVWGWIQSLPSISQWRTDAVSMCIHPSKSSQPSLSLLITRSLQNHTPISLSFSIVADFELPISLWTSKPLKLKNTALTTDEETMSSLFKILITDVLKYGLNKNMSFINIPSLETVSNFRDMFNLAFFTLVLLICIYEAPRDLRSACLNTLKDQLTSTHSREVSKVLMKFLGSNVEEQWMRSLNLAITNWIREFKGHNHYFKTPTPLFSYSVSTVGLWKVQLYCPVIAMNLESSSNTSVSEHLMFSLTYHQLEGVIQFGYKVIIQEKWVDLVVFVDNIRCDVISLVSETLMAERGAGAEEKYFPSHISLQLTPTVQTNILSVSVSKSSENPAREFGTERSIEIGFEPPNNLLGLKVSATDSMTMSLKPWRFEQSVYGSSANLNWFLHDSMDGREVFSSKPSKLALVQPNAWFKDRYSSASRPFTKQGGVVFAGDEYGDGVKWKVDRKAVGKTMEWEIKGRIWLTYWPNKYRTLYNETRSLEFKEILQLHLL
ncbi:hypothetical protein Scep_005773 [Stephania cephalantha]|uniref:Uncharacterized protein n=1 Tax=Stephania cephalantha TaxID=152367 RepID=A0AAP0KWN3_9MAGN